MNEPAFDPTEEFTLFFEGSAFSCPCGTARFKRYDPKNLSRYACSACGMHWYGSKVEFKSLGGVKEEGEKMADKFELKKKVHRGTCAHAGCKKKEKLFPIKCPSLRADTFDICDVHAPGLPTDAVIDNTQTAPSPTPTSPPPNNDDSNFYWDRMAGVWKPKAVESAPAAQAAPAVVAPKSSVMIDGTGMHGSLFEKSPRTEAVLLAIYAKAQPVGIQMSLDPSTPTSESFRLTAPSWVEPEMKAFAVSILDLIVQGGFEVNFRDWLIENGEGITLRPQQTAAAPAASPPPQAAPPVAAQDPYLSGILVSQAAPAPAAPPPNVLNVQVQLQPIDAEITEGKAWLVEIQKAVIVNEEQHTFWAKILQDVKGKAKRIDIAKHELTKPFNEGLKKIREFFAPGEALYEGMERDIKLKIADYHNRLRQVRNEAVAALQIASPQVTPAQTTQALTVLAAAQPPSVQGVVVREVWKFEVVDESQVPRHLLTPNLPAIKALVDSGARDIPGVRIFSDSQVRANAS